MKYMLDANICIRIGDNDMLIAANAKAENAILVTNNVREFERVDGLIVENWAL